MMAADSTPPSPGLPDATLLQVRNALEAYQADPTQVEALRAALRELAREARERSIMPERLLVALKDAWHSLPAVQSATDVMEQARALQQAVTVCIREYYD